MTVRPCHDDCDLPAIMHDMIARRVRVETMLWEMAAGKRPPPDAETCREMARILGVPGEASPLRRPRR